MQKNDKNNNNNSPNNRKDYKSLHLKPPATSLNQSRSDVSSNNRLNQAREELSKKQQTEVAKNKNNKYTGLGKR